MAHWPESLRPPWSRTSGGPSERPCSSHQVGLPSRSTGLGMGRDVTAGSDTGAGTVPAMSDFNRPAMSDFNQQIIEEFRANGGVVGGPFEGAPMLLLHSTGAKSGQ